MLRPTVLLLSISALALATCSSPAPESDAPAGGGVGRGTEPAPVAGWIEAAGGAAAWDGIRTLRYTVTTVWYDPVTAAELRRRPRHVWVRKVSGGFQVRVEREEPEGRYVQVWDGRRSWATLNGERLADSAAAVVEIPHVAGDLTYWIGLPWKLRDPGVILTEAAGGSAAADVRVVEVSFAPGIGLSPGDRYWYHFPADSAFPYRVDFQKEGLPAEARERTLWRDWRRHALGAYVGERLYVDVAGRPEKALLFEAVSINERPGGALFRAPRRRS